MSARVPTSRAYWNLRAEQVMDNVFDRETVTAPSQPHLVPVDVDVHEPTTKPNEPSERRYPSTWLLPLISGCLLYTSPSPRDRTRSRMPSSA